MNFDRILILIAATTLTTGCHLFSKLTPDCHSSQEYQRAREVAPLKVPNGLDAPNTQGAMVIPAVALAPPAPGPKDACLETPPRYQASPTNKAAGTGAAAQTPSVQ